MTINRTLTDTELQALGRVIDHFGPDEFRHYKDDGRPHGHIAESLLALNHYTQKYDLERDDEVKGQAELENRAPMPGDWAKDLAAGRPNGEPDEPDAMDDFYKVQWSILYCLLQSANHPDEIKRFVDDALKAKDANLLRAALRALDSYDMPEIPF